MFTVVVRNRGTRKKSIIACVEFFLDEIKLKKKLIFSTKINKNHRKM